jgi:hypothetical protein
MERVRQEEPHANMNDRNTSGADEALRVRRRRMK